MTELPAMSDTKLPVTLDWYRDTFKWFVALASGILAFSVTLVKDRTIESSVTKYSFLLVCFFFGLSALFGVWAYLWAVKFGNSRENREIFKHRITEEPDSKHLAEWQERLEEAEKDAETAQRFIGLTYYVMIYAFLLGVPAFAVLAGSLLQSKETPECQTSQVSILLEEDRSFSVESKFLCASPALFAVFPGTIGPRSVRGECSSHLQPSARADLFGDTDDA